MISRKPKQTKINLTLIKLETPESSDIPYFKNIFRKWDYFCHNVVISLDKKILIERIFSNTGLRAHASHHKCLLCGVTLWHSIPDMSIIIFR